MTIIQPRRASDAPTVLSVTSLLGTLLVAAPLALGVLAALAALTGRFGGRGNAFTAVWYVAAAAAPLALAGVVLLVLSHRHDALLRRILLWSAVAAAGWLFAFGSAQVDGLADNVEDEAQLWQYALLGVGVAVYLVALLILTITSWRRR